MKRPKKKSPIENKQIGIIEDVADNIYSIRFILQSLGYSVTSFTWRDSYVAELMQFSPHLIIVDMMIPDGGGFEVIHTLKASRLKAVPVLAITAEAMAGNQKDVFQAGGQDVLAKPYSVTDLQKKLKKWLK